MFFSQAAEQFRLFTGIAPDQQRMREYMQLLTSTR
ncbi:hypothetical protein [Caballeronia telluris]|nr:hypothetical protein [Caballeronia telluris]